MNLKRIFYWTLMIFGVLNLIDFIFLLCIQAVMNVGNALPGVLGVFLVVLSYLKLFKNVKLIKNVYIARVIIGTVIIFIISFATVEVLIWTSNKDERSVKTDYVILLGAGLKGSEIPITFLNRMEICFEYLKENPDTKVIVTGGQGYGEDISEAEAMRRYLVEHGIVNDRIIKEDKATSTFENFKYSKELLIQNFGEQKYSIMIVTSDFHMFRAKMLAARNGFIPYGIPAKTWWGVFPNSCAREYFAVVKSFVFDR